MKRLGSIVLAWWIGRIDTTKWWEDDSVLDDSDEHAVELLEPTQSDKDMLEIRNWQWSNPKIALTIWRRRASSLDRSHISLGVTRLDSKERRGFSDALAPHQQQSHVHIHVEGQADTLKAAQAQGGSIGQFPPALRLANLDDGFLQAGREKMTVNFKSCAELADGGFGRPRHGFRSPSV